MVIPPSLVRVAELLFVNWPEILIVPLLSIEEFGSAVKKFEEVMVPVFVIEPELSP